MTIMVRLKTLSAGSPLHRRCRNAWIAGLALALSACGSMSPQAREESRTASHQYQAQYSFVRIEHIEAGAQDNSHPFAISAERLRQALRGWKIKGLAGEGPLFGEDELTEIVPHLAGALAKAGRKEDVIFAVAGNHGMFGGYSPRTLTGGRAFVRDRQLNIIFGLVQYPFERDLIDGKVPPLAAGSRMARTDSHWTIEPGNARLVGNRPDWVMADTTTIPLESKPAAAPANSRYQEIEDKLRTLERLRANGVITEEEYRERRRAILQGI
jgi:hypothetical protein